MQLTTPLVLLLAPLLLLPLLRNRRDALDFPSVDWLPVDQAGRWLEVVWRVLGVFTLAAVLLALAGPGTAQGQREVVGRGAEIAILMDRSSSMDADIRRNAPEPGTPVTASQTKNEVVREALIELVGQRVDNRYALTLFNSAAMRAVPFTDDEAVIVAALEATGIGRGPSETHMGLALLAAIEAFEGRRYTGSRAIVLVSDGGARLEPAVRQSVSDGLLRNRISLYFVYIPSSPNSPDLTRVGLQSDTAIEEVALHRFFAGLAVPYQVYQAGDPESMAAAVDAIDAEQNLPLVYYQSVPRRDFTPYCLLAALAGCVLLTVIAFVRRERWS